MTAAITREVSSRFNECEITNIDRAPIDVDTARAEHHEYVKALTQLECQVIELPEERDLPDSVFVEDAAFILPEAVWSSPGPGLIHADRKQNPSCGHCLPTARSCMSANLRQWTAAMCSCLAGISILAFQRAVTKHLFVKYRNYSISMVIK